MIDYPHLNIMSPASSGASHAVTGRVRSRLKSVEKAKNNWFRLLLSVYEGISLLVENQNDNKMLLLLLWPRCEAHQVWGLSHRGLLRPPRSALQRGRLSALACGHSGGGGPGPDRLQGHNRTRITTLLSQGLVLLVLTLPWDESSI